MRQPSDGPSGTILDQIGRHWIWLHCPCGRATKHDPGDLAERLGPDLPLKDLARRARCRVCGAAGSMLTIQPPYYKDGSDRPREATGLR